MLPPPAPGIAEHVVFTTPYVLLTPGLLEWRAYFTGVLSGTPKHAQLDAYESHMKYGPARRYWNEFVFEGYVNHQKEAIFLAGLPDIPVSRPHSVAAWLIPLLLQGGHPELAVFLLGVPLAFINFRYYLSRCPRCGLGFFTRSASRAALLRRGNICGHCGLSLYAYKDS